MKILSTIFLAFLFLFVSINVVHIAKAHHTCDASTDSGSEQPIWVSASTFAPFGDGYFSIWAYFTGAGVGTLVYNGGPWQGRHSETVKSVSARPWATGHHSAYINNQINFNENIDEDSAP